MSPDPAVTLVVPCFNEAARLDAEAFAAALDRVPRLRLVFVDDGSTDQTADRLEAFRAASPDRVRVMRLAANRGKAEAVRQGVLAAFEEGAPIAGYWDADLATPLSELPALAATFAQAPEVEIVLGSRVRLLGRDIQRSVARHYTGRIFATLASIILRLAVYDTQCGAKLFRTTAAVRAAFERPFETRWTFDVELLARFKAAARRDGGPPPVARLREVPLSRWREVPGSKLGLADAPAIALDLYRIWRRR
jgi:glycosyltransferase involved in cell wall biosynthesis